MDTTTASTGYAAQSINRQCSKKKRPHDISIISNLWFWIKRCVFFVFEFNASFDHSTIANTSATANVNTNTKSLSALPILNRPSTTVSTSFK